MNLTSFTKHVTTTRMFIGVILSNIYLLFDKQLFLMDRETACVCATEISHLSQLLSFRHSIWSISRFICVQTLTLHELVGLFLLTLKLDRL